MSQRVLAVPRPHRRGEPATSSPPSAACRGRSPAARSAQLLEGMGLAEFTAAAGAAPLRRHEAEADAGHHPHARARPAAARRADHRRRPGLAPGVLAHPRRPAPAGHDRAGRHAVHGRGRALHRDRVHGRRAASRSPAPRTRSRRAFPGDADGDRGHRPAGRAGRASRPCPGWRRRTCSATSSACCGRARTSPSGALRAALRRRGRARRRHPRGRRPTWRPCSPSSPTHDGER